MLPPPEQIQRRRTAFLIGCHEPAYVDSLNMPGIKHKDWTREEHILAFNLYLKIPFGTIHMRNPRVMELA